MATKELIESIEPMQRKGYTDDFMDQFRDLNTDKKRILRIINKNHLLV